MSMQKPKNTKTVREKAWDLQLRTMSKSERKESIQRELKHKARRLEVIKKDLLQAKKLAKQKGPYSYEAEVRVPQKKEEYREYKTVVTNMERRLKRLNLTKPKK
jgi:hypothetical protein